MEKGFWGALLADDAVLVGSVPIPADKMQFYGATLDLRRSWELEIWAEPRNEAICQRMMSTDRVLHSLRRRKSPDSVRRDTRLDWDHFSEVARDIHQVELAAVEILETP